MSDLFTPTVPTETGWYWARTPRGDAVPAHYVDGMAHLPRGQRETAGRVLWGPPIPMPVSEPVECEHSVLNADGTWRKLNGVFIPTERIE